MIEADNVEDFLKTSYNVKGYRNSSTYYLPNALHLNADWNFYGKLFLNINGDISLTNSLKYNSNSTLNSIQITPRFESKWLSFYTPISYNEFSGLNYGLGLRTGIFFIGSSVAFNNLIDKNIKAADVYFGFKIPIYKGQKTKKIKETKETKKTKEIQEVKEVKEAKVKKTKEEVITASAIIAPTSKKTKNIDSDEDGILDKDDKCPDIAGLKENNGCPWDDADGDGILDKDDRCPKEACPPKTLGCTNDGCKKTEAIEPETAKKIDEQEAIKKSEIIAKEATKKLEGLSFNSGKSTITSNSILKLNDASAVLKDVGIYFVDGHTDNNGNAKSNLRLSKERAKTVVNELIKRGVPKENLIARGFGSSKPITSNTTPEGRLKNRRVVLEVALKEEIAKFEEQMKAQKTTTTQKKPTSKKKTVAKKK